MNTRPLIITNDQLLRMANVPSDAKVESLDFTAGRNRGKFDGICVRISSKEFKAEDQDKPIELKGQKQ